jgi:hypothetical protein
MRICVYAYAKELFSRTHRKSKYANTQNSVFTNLVYTNNHTQTSRHITELRALNKLTQKQKNVDADTQNHILLTRYRIMLEKEPPFVDVEPHYARKG